LDLSTAGRIRLAYWSKFGRSHLEQVAGCHSVGPSNIPCFSQEVRTPRPLVQASKAPPYRTALLRHLQLEVPLESQQTWRLSRTLVFSRKHKDLFSFILGQMSVRFVVVSSLRGEIRKEICLSELSSQSNLPSAAGLQGQVLRQRDAFVNCRARPSNRRLCVL
jgi:hypothetical protein